ncbi:Gfo/Idh/MocA family protein [Falsirhodobacter xinxiangensis]|uniref:Gfo/Idh/MocA family protein n=1 Tax=Falsirhodobacter xinxiangensis TaxID=2530049 RepID=UPI0010AB034F|nr:Gfo/Idh/MocA family oxidoreductase [Rhodobacter xinxiangensis]
MRYAIVGTGGRHRMFRKAIVETHAEGNELVALCDMDPHRLNLSAASLPEGTAPALYAAEDFGRMLREMQPDCVVVTTPDHLHHIFIDAALRAGSDVITEKPMTTDLSRLKTILDAQGASNRSVAVSFNYRYSPARTQIKDLLMSGAIGDITAVDFRWALDRVHGADYFRRWHRQKDNSGGLLVHKSTHHFDLMNWWVESRPRKVHALGRRVFYTPQTGDALGLTDRGTRCRTCPAFDRCDYRLDIAADEALDALYLQGEESSGYIRDACVFSDDISIEDTMQVQIEYENEVTCNYTLTAYSPWEGLEITFHGTKGELTHRHIEVHGVFAGERNRAVDDNVFTELHLFGEHPRQIDVWEGKGIHGGADPIMLGYLFAPETMPEDLYKRRSDHVSGAWSILTGIAANESIASGRAVDVGEMLDHAGIAI